MSEPELTETRTRTLPTLRIRLTRESLVRYAGASLDFNPIHYSDHYAKSLGQPSVIAHGMLTMGVALRVATRWLGGPDRLRSYDFRFTAPVPIPDNADGVDVDFDATLIEVPGENPRFDIAARLEETVVGEGHVEFTSI